VQVQVPGSVKGKTQLVDVPYVINGTLVKLPLPTPLASGASAVLEIDWSYAVPENSRNGRGVRELVKDGWLYEMAQWYPRASVYDDVNGWQTDQFLGQGEFYLNFGNYDVSLTVPHDHIVQGTGVIVNQAEVLTATQRTRLAEAFTSETPKFIITADEVMTPGSRPAGTSRRRMCATSPGRHRRRSCGTPRASSTSRPRSRSSCTRSIHATRCHSGTRCRPGRSPRQ
jgi:hypothetical protein